jgi:pimeloyl-ACP methyl ester carboxylesterase
MAGEEDIHFPPEEAHRMAAGIRNAEFVSIPHAGHMLLSEQPEGVTKAIASFPSQVGAFPSSYAFRS